MQIPSFKRRALPRVRSKSLEIGAYNNGGWEAGPERGWKANLSKDGRPGCARSEWNVAFLAKRQTEAVTQRCQPVGLKKASTVTPRQLRAKLRISVSSAILFSNPLSIEAQINGFSAHCRPLNPLETRRP